MNEHDGTYPLVIQRSYEKGPCVNIYIYICLSVFSLKRYFIINYVMGIFHSCVK